MAGKLVPEAEHLELVRAQARADADACMCAAEGVLDDAVLRIALPTELRGLLHLLAEQADETVDVLVVRALRDFVACEVGPVQEDDRR